MSDDGDLFIWDDDALAMMTILTSQQFDQTVPTWEIIIGFWFQSLNFAACAGFRFICFHLQLLTHSVHPSHILRPDAGAKTVPGMRGWFFRCKANLVLLTHCRLLIFMAKPPWCYWPIVNCWFSWQNKPGVIDPGHHLLLRIKLGDAGNRTKDLLLFWKNDHGDVDVGEEDDEPACISSCPADQRSGLAGQKNHSWKSGWQWRFWGLLASLWSDALGVTAVVV